MLMNTKTQIDHFLQKFIVFLHDDLFVCDVQYHEKFVLLSRQQLGPLGTKSVVFLCLSLIQSSRVYVVPIIDNN